MAESDRTSTSMEKPMTHLSSKDMMEAFLTENKTAVEHLLTCINECLSNFDVEQTAYRRNDSIESKDEVS